MDALHGLRVLVAGEDPKTLDAARTGLAAQGAHIRVCDADPGSVVAAVASDPPDAVLALDESEERLRAGLDPLGLMIGPPVVPVLDVVGPRDPFDAIAARRLSALVQLHALRERAGELEGVIAAQAVSRRRELESAQVDGLRRLALAAEYRDDNTHEHTQRVGHMAAQLARGVGLGDRMVWLVREAAPLHDLGKIAIPDSILLKPGKLSDGEYEVVKTHALLGARVLAGAESELLEVADKIVRHHHERWDGDGYPDGLRGEEIPLAARVFAVADTLDALTTDRPYRPAVSLDFARATIAEGAGTQFDPEIVVAFASVPDEAIEHVRREAGVQT